MLNVIAFLESMGRNAVATPAGAEFVAAVEALEIDDRARHALLAGDAAALNELLGGRPKMICALFPADDDEKKDDDQPADEPDEQKESVDSRGLH